MLQVLKPLQFKQLSSLNILVHQRSHWDQQLQRDAYVNVDLRGAVHISLSTNNCRLYYLLVQHSINDIVGVSTSGKLQSGLTFYKICSIQIYSLARPLLQASLARLNQNNKISNISNQKRTGIILVKSGLLLSSIQEHPAFRGQQI